MMFNDESMHPFGSIVRECLIDGKVVPYDACSSAKSLQQAKEIYSHMTYIGSGYAYFINGTENISTTLHHFFIEKNNQS